MNVTQWHGCYSGSWQGILVPDAFAHPAKVAPGLSYRIYRYMLDAGYIAPGDSVFDPFGGIGGFGYHAMLLGLHWTGVELEPRFVELGQRNIDKWRRDLAMLNGTLGTARLLQGDSRRLLEVVGGGMGAAVSSPPYEASVNDPRNGGGIDRAKFANPNKHAPRAASIGANTVATFDYGSTPGQLGSMPSGDYAAAVGSPPYADAINNSGEGPGARHDPIYHNGDNAYKQSSANGYGNAPGQLGRMAGEGFEAAVGSPPFGEQQSGGGIAAALSGNSDYETAVSRSIGSVNQGYANQATDPANLANDTGETFWAAARIIVEQTYAALRPGGYAAWVTKCFVRKGAIVPFSDQWEQLCAAVGFVPVERIAAMLVDDHGDQLDIFGGVTARRKERKSFFRRLAEKKGSPRIDHEDVIIMRKPVTE